MANTSLEYLLIAGNALARAEWQSDRLVTSEDVTFAAQKTAQDMVAANRVTSAEADLLVKNLPAAWTAGPKFDTRFFQELRKTAMLGVDSESLEPLIAGVSAAIQEAGAARVAKAAVDARNHVPAELLTPVSAGMDYEALVEELTKAFAHPVFLAELGGGQNVRLDSELARSAYGVSKAPGAVQAVAFNQEGKAVEATLLTLPMPTTIHDLAFALATAQYARSCVTDSGFWGAILGSKIGISAGQAPGSQWTVSSRLTDAGLVIGLEVNNIDAQLTNFRDPPARDDVMDARVSAYVASIGKELADEVAKGTPLLKVKLDR